MSIQRTKWKQSQGLIVRVQCVEPPSKLISMQRPKACQGLEVMQIGLGAKRLESVLTFLKSTSKSQNHAHWIQVHLRCHIFIIFLILPRFCQVYVFLFSCNFYFLWWVPSVWVTSWNLILPLEDPCTIHWLQIYVMHSNTINSTV